MVIAHSVVIDQQGLSRDGVLLANSNNLPADDLYCEAQCSYPKFYKMDKLCKWAFIATEFLLQNASLEKTDKSKIGVVLATSHGCLDVDKRYSETISMPSPALFVYTLPNIMLGEISIRHGFKGEQLCLVAEEFDIAEIHFAATVLLQQKGMEACLCGWVNAVGDQHDVCLYWVTKNGDGINFDISTAGQLYKDQPWKN